MLQLCWRGAELYLSGHSWRAARGRLGVELSYSTGRMAKKATKICISSYVESKLYIRMLTINIH